MEEISKMIQYAEEFGKPSMEKLSQMDIKEIFNFMDNFLLDQDFSAHVAKKTFLEKASTTYDVRYRENKKLESITLNKNYYDVITIEINVLGIFCYFKGEHHSRQTITKISWKYLKDIMFKD